MPQQELDGIPHAYLAEMVPASVPKTAEFLWRLFAILPQVSLQEYCCVQSASARSKAFEHHHPLPKKYCPKRGKEWAWSRENYATHYTASHQLFHASEGRARGVTFLAVLNCA